MASSRFQPFALALLIPVIASASRAFAVTSTLQALLSPRPHCCLHHHRIGIAVDKFVFSNMVRACSILQDVELSKEIHGHVVKLEDGLELLVQNSLVATYAKCNVVEGAEIVFDQIGEYFLIEFHDSKVIGYHRTTLHFLHSLGIQGNNDSK